MATSPRTVRLKDDTCQSVDDLADICGRDSNFIMKEAIEEYVEHHGWIIRETEKRLNKLKSGQATLVSHDEVKDSIMQRVSGLQ